MKVLGIGNALVDILVRLKNDEFLEKYSLQKGVMQLVNHDYIKELLDATLHIPQKLSSGGSAANTIHGLARLGIPCAFMGKIGNDEFGKIFLDDLKKSQIEPLLYYSLSPTGRAFTMVSPDGERTFATFLGASVELLEGDIESEVFKGCDLFHIEGYLVQNHKLIEKCVRVAKRNHLKVSLDLASHNIVTAHREFLLGLIEEYVDILFANDEEAKALTGRSPEESVVMMAADCEIAVVKLGEYGSLVRSRNEQYVIRPIKANCIDTTGAGDLYAAGFLYGLIKEKDLEWCGKAGSLLSGKVVEVLGAKLEDNQWEEIKAELALSDEEDFFFNT